ncbi:MAG: nucleotidyltransferase domain-containing protein [Armatimonadota bacterium]
MRNLEKARVVSVIEKRMLFDLKDIVARYDSQAEIVLYGSTARGRRQPDSDYDLVVITSRKLSSHEERNLDRDVYGLQLEKGVVLSVIVYAKEQWQDPVLQVSPYRKNVMKEGIVV